jgi:hypothetical protein
MNDVDLLQPINDALSELLAPSVRAQFAGRVQSIYDPQSRRAALLHYDPQGKPARFTIDTKHYDLQVAYKLTGGTPIKHPARFGTRQEIAFDLSWTLMCATKRPEMLSSFLLTFTRLRDMDVIEFNTDALSVLKNEFLFIPDPKLPYDPLLQCFSIRFKLLNVSDAIFSLLCSPID